MPKARVIKDQGEFILLNGAHLDTDVSIRVGTAAWYEWLQDNRSFSFDGGAGQFSALKERVREKGWYWKAYHWRDGRRQSVYLGRSEDLSTERLEQAEQRIFQTNASKSDNALQRVARTKLFVPSLRPGRVVRQRLLQRLRSGSQMPVTVVVAPAGYGKTTLVAEWIRTDKREAAWLSLDGGDNAPTQFWASFGAALDILQPDSLQNIKAEMSALQQRPSPSAIMAGLINEITTRMKLDGRGRPKILVIDDLHLITHPDLAQAIVYFADHLPPSLHMVITTRHEANLPMARWKVQHRASDLRPADLAFNDFEARAFLIGTMGLKLDEDAVGLLEARTEGWIAALQLAALSLQSHADPAVFIGQFRGNQQHVMSYLVDQVLARLPLHVLDFITRASVLDRMCDDLCQALLDDPASPDAPTLHALEQENLFVVALDDERRWYRFHQLFADLLRTRLNQDQPGLERVLHARAAQWFEDAGDVQASIQQAMLAQEYEHAARLIEADIASTWVQQSIVAPSGTWVDQLPDAPIRRRPLLMLAKAANLLRQLQINAARDWLDQLDAALATAPDEENAEIVGARALMLRAYTLRMQQADSAQVLEASERALANIPKHDHVWRANALMTHASLLYAFFNDAKRAYASCREAAELALQHEMRTTHIECLMMGALMLTAGGWLRRAEGTLEEVRRLMQAWNMPNATARNWREDVSMRLAYERNDLQAVEVIAQPLLARAIDGTDPIHIINAVIYLFRMHMARGTPSDALSVINAAEPVCASNPFTARHISIMRAFLQATQHDTALLEGWVEDAMSRPDMGSWRIPGVHEDMRQWVARACVLLGKPAQACLVLNAYIDSLDGKQATDTLIRCLAIRACAHEQSGSRAAALEDVRRALALGKSEGYLRTFLDGGPAMLNLLLDARTRNIEPAYVMKLLDAFGVRDAPANDRVFVQAASLAEPAPWVESISAREQQVLALLAAGHTNQSIADTLSITLTTVKSHAGSIYAKLGVKSRTQAIARARELGLLS
jgi:LuxR family maltose regulon positive regulatory protein